MKIPEPKIYPARMEVAAGIFVVHEPFNGHLAGKWLVRERVLPVIICSWWRTDDTPGMVGIVSQSFQ